MADPETAMRAEAQAQVLWRTARTLASDLAQAAGGVRGPAAGAPVPPLLFLTDPDRTPRPWETAARLPAGAGVVFRHFGRGDPRADARRLREATSAAGVRLLIGADADLAEAVGADGLHLPERLADQWRERVRPGRLLTVAAHSPAAARGIGARDGVDAVLLSPVFPAGGASAARPPLGADALLRPSGEAYSASITAPFIALGGVDVRTAPGLIGKGWGGLAGIGAIRAAFGP